MTFLWARISAHGLPFRSRFAYNSREKKTATTAAKTPLVDPNVDTRLKRNIHAEVARNRTLVTTTGPNSGSVTSPVAGTVTLVNPLPPNGTTTFTPTLDYPSVLAGVASWDFSSQLTVLNSTDAGAVPWNQPTFSFTTRNGVIVSWKFTVPVYEPGSAEAYFALTITSTVNGDTVESSGRNPAFDPHEGEFSSITGSNNTPGTWTCMRTFTSAYP